MAKRFVIGEESANKIVQYLAGRPYAEVFRLIADLQQLEECSNSDPKPQPKESSEEP